MGTSPSKNVPSTPKGSKTVLNGTPIRIEDLPDEYKITVINSGSKDETIDPLALQLENLPRLPPTILEAAESRRFVTDHFNLLSILATYQQVLTDGSVNITKNQDHLMNRIVPTMLYTNQALHKLHEGHHNLAQAESYLDVMSDIQQQISKAQDACAYIISYIDQLESLLPEEESFRKPISPEEADSSYHTQ